MPRRNSRTAHPRSRGEHCQPCRAGERPLGSSPLARGTPAHVANPGVAIRLIPARAGNTPDYPEPSNQPAAHPRSRGEHFSQLTSKSDAGGSSPLARGTPSITDGVTTTSRLIPARAGNTITPPPPSSLSAHPRSRGEHRNRVLLLSCQGGSSPLARGTHIQAVPLATVFRLIPARAGNTVRAGKCGRLAPAHPRSRGEHYYSPITYTWPDGSSPLARGTRCRGIPRYRGSRLIPARAGNTVG